MRTAERKTNTVGEQQERAEHVEDEAGDGDDNDQIDVGLVAFEALDLGTLVGEEHETGGECDEHAQAGQHLGRMYDADEDEQRHEEHHVVGLIVQQVVGDAVAQALRVAHVRYRVVLRFAEEIGRLTERRKLSLVQYCYCFISVIKNNSQCISISFYSSFI